MREFGREAVRQQALLVGRHLHVARLVQRERLQRAEVGRGFDEDRAARIDERLAEQVERLLRAGRDQHLRRARCSARRSIRAAAGSLRSLYWSAAAGASRSTRSAAARMRSAGNVAGAGRPPANEMTSGRSVTFRISRMAETVSLRARSESCQCGGCGRSTAVPRSDIVVSQERSLGKSLRRRRVGGHERDRAFAAGWANRSGKTSIMAQLFSRREPVARRWRPPSGARAPRWRSPRLRTATSTASPFRRTAMRKKRS